MSNELYTIIVSGEKLAFTKDQILSDPGNYFATYFFGNFAEGSRGAREIFVQKDVQLFKLIQAHLRGYEILPLAETAIPWYMTREGALANLLHEARFYCLRELVKKIEAAQSQKGPSVPVVASGQPMRYKYELAARDRMQNWKRQVISEDMYKLHLNRFSGLRRVSVLADISIHGDAAELAWEEHLTDDIAASTTRVYALLKVVL